MSHQATERFARERIADWHREADGNRLMRANPGFDAGPAGRQGTSGLAGRLIARLGPVGRLSSWLGQVRRFAEHLALAT